ncbi:MAG: methylated-DNA--[protein]-cysteine S-methyltransferase [archaeon]|nr:methylated-DNA--[protein]-cysteine S-methyltransferase [archaeon]
MTSIIRTYPTLLGRISLVSDGTAITALYLPTENLPAMEEGEDDVMREAIAQIEEYLAGNRRTFDIPTRQDGTDFRREVWNGISDIPYGRTRTYGELAEAIGHPRAYRAVGTSCGLNRLPIIVPCHRVVASDGIGSYSGGIEIKRRLLVLEEEFR